MLVYNETQPFVGQIFLSVWFYFFNQCRLYSEIGFVLVFFLVFVAFLFAPLRPRGFSFLFYGRVLIIRHLGIMVL